MEKDKIYETMSYILLDDEKLYFVGTRCVHIVVYMFKFKVKHKSKQIECDICTGVKVNNVI